MMLFYDSYFKVDSSASVVMGRSLDDYTWLWLNQQLYQKTNGGFFSLSSNWLGNFSTWDNFSVEHWLINYDSNGYGPGVKGAATGPITSRMAAKDAMQPQNPLENERKFMSEAPGWLADRVKNDPILLNRVRFTGKP